MSCSGLSATSGSRLFISMRSAASCCQPRQESWVPRGARIVRGSATVVIVSILLLGWFHSAGTDIIQCALRASRFASDADGAAVSDEAVRERRPFLRRNQLHEVLLNLLGVKVPS